MFCAAGCPYIVSSDEMLSGRFHFDLYHHCNALPNLGNHDPVSISWVQMFDPLSRALE